MKKKKSNIVPIRKKKTQDKASCGLCGKKTKLIKTECCDNWICDDTDKYVMFSYARNSCYRNHDRYTLCSYHYHEGHKGHWKDCEDCKKSFQTEIYVGYGTNEYNFEVLENPPAYEPTKCSTCGVVINLGDGGYSTLGDRYQCEKCTAIEMEKKIKEYRKT